MATPTPAWLGPRPSSATTSAQMFAGVPAHGSHKGRPIVHLLGASSPPQRSCMHCPTVLRVTSAHLFQLGEHNKEHIKAESEGKTRRKGGMETGMKASEKKCCKVHEIYCFKYKVCFFIVNL